MKTQHIDRIYLDDMDWPSELDAERNASIDRLWAWFNGLSKKSKTAIAYALKELENMDDPEDCPWLQMVTVAQDRCRGKTYGNRGCNLQLYYK
jgi:hypothetical protein